ncbi:MAG TPA: YhjD/YihY/BrkB family envelope integrity protein [Patescibacteria group bacterium]|nr:YhjD/YihY/BrkB family envelope integrity protein [Patescibacteria group bacterium]
MSYINKTINKINTVQENHRFFAFTVAVIKKYSDDSAGQQAALLTYYGFLSLFPLLLILTTLTDVVLGKNLEIQRTVLNGLTNYFPLLGSQLSTHVHRINAGGLALFAGILFTLYGTRGVANTFRFAMYKIWRIDKKHMDTFPLTLYKSISLVIIGGFGFILASVIAGLTSSSGHGIVFKSLSILVDIIVLFWLYNFLINFSLPKHITFDDIWVGAIFAACGLVILQALGNLIIAKELKRLDALYSYFAVALGLLFWIYLQTQVLLYSIEIAVVKSQKLWPRSLEAHKPTPADKAVLSYDK